MNKCRNWLTTFPALIGRSSWADWFLASCLVATWSVFIPHLLCQFGRLYYFTPETDPVLQDKPLLVHDIVPFVCIAGSGRSDLWKPMPEFFGPVVFFSLMLDLDIRVLYHSLLLYFLELCKINFISLNVWWNLTVTSFGPF